MKKRLMAALLCVSMMIASVALADGLTSDLISRGKDALEKLASGDTQGALDKLNFQFEEGSGYSADGFTQFVSNSFSLLGSGVQRDVALTWYDGSMWRLGIPLVEPVSDDVEVLVLLSRDGANFCGYEASTWGSLVSAANSAQKASWHGAYEPGEPVLWTDDVEAGAVDGLIGE